MTQHDLHRAQIGAPLKQMGGKGVPEGVGMNFLRHIRFCRVLFHDLPESLPRQPLSQAVQKKDVALAIP